MSARISGSLHGKRAILAAAVLAACAGPSQTPPLLTLPELEPRLTPPELESPPIPPGFQRRSDSIQAQALRPMTIAEAAQGELDLGARSIVVGLYHEGAIQYLEAWGHPSLDSTEPLSSDALFPVEDLTEVLVAATARGLSAIGALDTEAGIRRYIRELPEGLGRITLSQLLTHTAGLDRFPVDEEEDWNTVLYELPDRALFIDPGLIYSSSPYSYPLAIRVLERATGEPIRQLITRALLEPLGMDRTTFDPDEAQALGLVQQYRRAQDGSLPFDPEAPLVAVDPIVERDGIPIVFTTVRDLLVLLAAFGEGGLRGESPFGRGPEGPDVLGGRYFRDGFWFEDYRLAPSAYLDSDRNSFRILLGTNTIVVGFGTDSAENLVLSRMADFFGLPPKTSRRPTSFPDPTSFTDPDIRDWVGDYLNGQSLIALREFEGGVAFFDGEGYLPIELLESGKYVGRFENGTVGISVSLYEFEGWKVVSRGRTAYARRIDPR